MLGKLICVEIIDETFPLTEDMTREWKRPRWRYFGAVLNWIGGGIGLGVWGEEPNGTR